jgi:hypothetical protein
MCYILLLLTQMFFLWEIHEFRQLAELAYIEQREPTSTLKTLIGRMYSFLKLTHFSQGNNVVDTCVLTQMVLFGEIHVFLQLCWIGWFETKTSNLHLKKTKLQEDFLSKTNSVLTGKLLLQHTQFFQEIHAFLQLSWIDLFGTKWAFQHLQNSDWQEIFLSKRVSILTRKKFARHSCF